MYQNRLISFLVIVLFTLASIWLPPRECSLNHGDSEEPEWPTFGGSSLSPLPAETNFAQVEHENNTYSGRRQLATRPVGKVCRPRRFLLNETAPSNSASSGQLAAERGGQGQVSARRGREGGILRVQVTAIHVEKSEFPLSRLLFKLTLKLALSDANKFLEQQQQQQQQQQRTQSDRHGQRASTQLRVRLALSVRSANTCSRQYASALAAEEYYVRRARLFILSGCDDAIRGVSRLASEWRVPIMTAAGFGAELNDKRVHRTLVRVAFSLRAAVEFLFKIMKSYQWRRANLVVDESDPNSMALRGTIERHMSETIGPVVQQNQSSSNLGTSLNTIVLDLQALLAQPSGPRNASSSGPPSDDVWPNTMTERVVQDTLRQCSMHSRVTILLVPQQHLRRFMLAAYDENMANGMYTFLSMPLLAAGAAAGDDGGSSEAAATSEFVWRSPQPGARNAHAKQAFESLMAIYLRTPATKAYVYFASKLSNLASSDISVSSSTSTSSTSTSSNNSSAGTSRRAQPNINPYSASFYDSVQIYAHALNESLGLEDEESATGRNRSQLHARISELVRNRRFENMVTGAIYINANGDRETDYTLDDMNQMTGKYAPVILFRGEKREIERMGRIHWSSDPTVGPTSDLVDCNLLGTCASRPMSRFTLLLMLLAAPLLLLMSGLFYLVHSRLSLESQLVDYWWKIHLSEIEIVMTRRRNPKGGSLVATSSVISSKGEEEGGKGGGGSSFASKLDGANADNGRAKLASTSGEGRADRSSLIGFGKANSGACDRTEVTRATTMDTNTSAGGWATSAADVCYGNITLGIFKLTKVALKPIRKFHQSRKLMIELRNIKDLNHANLCRFKGILVDEGNLAIVSEFCPKGSLREFFQNESMIIDWTFKCSIINDIIAGLLYLCSSSLGFHGRLKSSNCLVSGRFVVKLSDYGPHSLYNLVDEQEEEHDKESWLRKRIWLAPEHMKGGGSGGGGGGGVSGSSSRTNGSMKGDVYSFGLLLYEITTNCLPFFSPQKNDFCMPLKSLHQALKTLGPNEELGPDLGLIEQVNEQQQHQAGNALRDDQGPVHGASQGVARNPAKRINLQPLVELMKSCWHLEPSKRPTLVEVSTTLKRITRGVTSKKLLENLTSRMEQYTNNLESLVEAKLATLVEEKLKTEELLYQFVPKSVASLLKEGQFVEPEAFECVTVFYSDIVGFTSLSSESSPMQVVGFLSDLYLCFDETLERHDIFKVDTIGDAYIVASGLPLQNDGKHVVEIAQAALELRERLQHFKIPHKPGRSLEMRVGIHSGPCIAGIVGGLNMPKYCVFGDTLTTGKFMESSGLPMKIHITEESRALLGGLREFHIEPRVPKITKDGLPFQTYWLERGVMGNEIAS